MRNIFWAMLAFLMLQACGEPSEGETTRIDEPKINGFELSWTIGSQNPNCIRNYKIVYDTISQRGDRQIACVDPTNYSRVQSILQKDQILLSPDEQLSMRQAIDNIAFSSLSDVYIRSDGYADGVTFRLKVIADEQLKSVLVDASSSIPSPSLTQFFDLLNHVELLEESGYR